MRKGLIVIALLAIIFICSGCVEVAESQQKPPVYDPDRFVVEWEGAVSDGWLMVMHDTELNTTVYRTADGYGYQGVAVIADNETSRGK